MVCVPATLRLLILADESATVADAFAGAVGEPFACQCCAGMEALVHELDNGAGLVVLDHQQLGHAQLSMLTDWLAAQAPWSDLPVLVLDGAAAADGATLDRLGNVMVLDWPAVPLQLHRIARVALRARQRQYAASPTRESVRERRAWLQARKMEAIGRMSAAITHEFNNLLHVMSGNIDLLDLTASDPRQKRLTAKVKNAAGEAARLAQTLVAFQCKPARQPEHVDLFALVDGLRSRMAEAAGVALEFECIQEDGLPLALADPVGLEWVLLDLARNAGAAMPGGGRLWVSLVRARPGPQVLTDGSYCVILVRDSGSGIADDALDLVFDPFYHGSGRGRGLGLARAYALVRQAGGIMQIDNNEGGGACVEIWLPAASP